MPLNASFGKLCLPLLLSIALAACSDGGAIGAVKPNLVVNPDALSFGEVPLHATRSLSLTLKNSGSAVLHLARVEAAAPFRVEPGADHLMPTESTVLTVSLTPSALGPLAGNLVLTPVDGDGLPVTVALSGTGTASTLEIAPSEVDFRLTRLGETRSVDLVAFNLAAPAFTGTLRTEGFARPGHYSLSGLPSFDASAPATIPAKDRLTLSLSYHPGAPGDDGGRILLETCGDRCGLVVTIRASALSKSIRLEPAAIDFGGVGIGDAKSVTLTIGNDGMAPFDLLGLQSGSADVTLAGAGMLPASIPPGGTRAVQVTYAPSTEDSLAAALTVATGEPGGAALQVALSGRGEPPVLEARPTIVDFGIITRPDPTRRGFAVVNSGSGRATIRAVSLVGSDASFALTGLPGLPAMLGAGESFTGYVSFTPDARPLHATTIRVTGGTGGETTLEIPVRAGSGTPTCNLTAMPARLEFGAVLPATRKDLSATVVNGGTTPCTLTGAAFDQSDIVFAAGAVSWPVRLAPGESQALAFSYAPTSAGASLAIYSVLTDDPLTPTLKFRLTGAQVPICDGHVPFCTCLAGRTQTYHAFGIGHGGSGLTSGNDVAQYMQTCDAPSCPAGQVSVETSEGTFDCTQPPPPCSAPMGLDRRNGAWTCVPCAVVVQYGGLFAGQRSCAEDPVQHCGAGEKPTFSAASRQWECQPICDGGRYDPVSWEHDIVCVPC